MLNPIKILEYKTCEISDESNLKKDDLKKLDNYLKCQGLEHYLHVTPNGIKANSHVGVIKCKNLQVEILPKLLKGIDEYNFCELNKSKNIIKNLVFMLSYTKELDIKTSDSAKLSSCKNPFLEILIREYSNSLFDCLKRVTPKNYIREEDNLNFLRGKLKFTENIRYNSANQAKFYCEFDKFSEDNILNQLFLYVSTCLYNISNDSKNKKLLKLIMNYFCDIRLVRFNRFKVEKIKLNRNQLMFEKPFKLAKMFVENSSVDLSKNKFDNITLMWDMNKLFEEFVYELLRRNSNALSIKLGFQKCKKLLKDDHRPKRNTFVDIFITSPREIVIDTKYKELKSFNDVKNTDIFQVSTYCLIHGAQEAILIYPQYGEIKPNISDKYLNTDKNYKIKFKTINLQQEDLKDYVTNVKENNIINNIKEILGEENVGNN